MTSLIVRVGGVVLGLLLSAGWAGGASGESVGGVRAAAEGAGAPAVTDPLRPSERAFLEQSTATARLQRRLGELGLNQANRPELRGHAQQVTADYRQLAADIEGLIRRKGLALAPAATMPPEEYRQVASQTGDAFDRALTMTWVNVHEAAIALFESATADAKDPDVRELAAAQLPMLREHRNRITELRKAYE